jgi:hypothetical protein
MNLPATTLSIRPMVPDDLPDVAALNAQLGLLGMAYPFVESRAR